MEVLKLTMEKKEEEERKGEKLEVCLELSIGGSYGKSGNFWNPNEGKKTNFGEENLGILLEAKKFQSRFEDRKIREMEGFGEAMVRKRGRNFGNEVGNELNLSLFTAENRVSSGSECLYPKVQQGNAWNEESVCVLPSHRSSGCEPGNVKTASYGSSERSCSAVSDYQSTTPKGGGSSSDTGSPSSHSYPRQQTRPLTTSDQLNHNGQTEPNQPNHCSIKLPKHDIKMVTSASPKPDKPLSKETSDSLIDKRPKLPNPNPNVMPTRRMPCVTTTGNGPNGKTIAGFLYKYTNAEVVIMCVCHGGYFTPAEFVEHAGGVNVSQPLRQITVVPSPLD